MLGEYWKQDVVQIERTTAASGGSPPVADAYTINGHPGPNYNCSNNGN
jgi:laccase